VIPPGPRRRERHIAVNVIGRDDTLIATTWPARIAVEGDGQCAKR
jgi:hypothetical protein